MIFRLNTAFLLSILLFAMTAAGQVSGISKARIYSRNVVGGTAKADDNGFPKKNVNKEYLVFIETPRKAPEQEWNLVWVNQKSYMVTAVTIPQSKLKVGKTKGLKDVIIKPAPENRLVQLTLSPAAYRVMPPEAKQYAVVITGKWKGKAFKFRTSRIEELASVFHD